MSSNHPIEASVTIDIGEKGDVPPEEEEMKDDVSASSKFESEKEPKKSSKRPSILERMRSSKSKSENTSSSSEGEEDEGGDSDDDEEDEIKPLEERKRKQGTESVTRPSYQKQTSRYEDRLRNEDLAVQAAFEKRKESKKLSQQQQDKVISKLKPPTLEEAYDFFTRVDWAPAVQHAEKALKDDPSETAQEEGQEEANLDEHDKKTLLPASHYIGDKYLWDMTEPSLPEQDQRSDEQEKIITIVPTSRIDIEQKIGQDQQPRFLGDEGIYMGHAPHVSKHKNQNKLEHRVLMEKSNSKWFGTDGKLTALPNPIQKKATRPPNYEDQENSHLTFYCAPSLPGPDGLPTPVTTTGKLANSVSQCQLEVDLSSIIFDHHHLFSLEHFLAAKLASTFSTYSKLRLSMLSKDLEKRLDVLYQSIEGLKGKDWSSAEKEFHGRRLETYRTEIKAMQSERDTDSQKERQLVRIILGMWKEVRETRSRQGFSSTNLKILIKKESVNQVADRSRWEKELMREINFHREEHEATYQDNLSQYKKAMDTWKETHNRRKEARKRQKQRQKDAERGSGTADANEMADDEALLAEAEQTKPEMPDPWNENRVKKELEEHALACRRSPGEPKIYLELVTNHSTSANHEITQDNRELNRRNAVSKTKIFTRIFFNGKEVCQSSAKLLSSDFVVQVGQIFPIQILQLPESLTLQIIEGGTLKTTVVAEIKLPLCDSTQTMSEALLQPIEFKSDWKISHDHAGLGAGLNFPTNYDGSEISHQTIQGKVFARVGWAKGVNGTILAPPIDQWNPKNDARFDPLKEVMEPDGKIDPVKLEEWIAKVRLDPNDPENEELMARVNEAKRRIEMSSAASSSSGTLSKLARGQISGYFRLDQHQDQLVFCTDTEIQNNARFQMIQLRRAKVQEFKNYRMIPILDKEVPRGLLEARTKRALAKGKEVMDRGDPLRGRSRLYLEQLRAQVNHRFSLARHRRRHADVVMEDPLPTSDTLLMFCGEMVPAQRPLKPTRIERKKVLMQDMSNQDIKILLSVVRAYDVPIRNDPDPMHVSEAHHGLKGSGQAPVPDHGLAESSVYSYIEAQFQGQISRTTVAIGPNPAWNQELTLSFKSVNNDYSPDTLNRVKESLHLHLFDEVLTDLVEDDEERGSQIHQRVEKKWLGSLSIPFSSLYRNAKIEGTFKLHSPPILLGYERSGIVGGLNPSQTEASSGMPMLGGGLAKNAKNATYLNIYVTLQPPLVVPEPVKEKLDCDEPEMVVQHCLNWSANLLDKYPGRRINSLVADVTGKSVLITRFFRPIRAPAEILEAKSEGGGNTSATLSIAWFVSLVPYIPRNGIFPGLQDIWPTCDQFIHMMVGSEVEHALLLCNFLAHLGKKAFLVIGIGVPEGETSYVLTVEDSGEHRLWNPMNGQSYSTNETFCPLEAVHAIANENNVWGNIQASAKPGRVRWDLSQTTDWAPLFAGNVSNPCLPSVQPMELTLTASDPRAAKQLKERIERSLRDTLMNLRKKMSLRTTMNFQGNAVLRKLLPSIEVAAKGGLSLNSEANGSFLASEHLNELQRIMTSHKICGFPLHFAFADIDQLSEAVLATGVHLNREPGVEFALAVHVEPYPASVMSVWVYVASLVRRR